jgi:HEXXH motif-containing protein
MTVRVHKVPRELFAALAEGGGGSAAVRMLADAEYSRTLLMLRGVVREAEAAGAEQAWLARDSFALLTEADQRNPVATGRVLRYPAVGAWLFRTLRRLHGDMRMSDAEPAGLGAVAAAAAIRAGVPGEVAVRPVAGAVMLPSLGAVETGSRTATVLISGTGAWLRTEHDSLRIPIEAAESAPGWLPLRRIRSGAFDILVDDLDPFRMPEVADVASRLAASEMSSWRASIRQGWRLLAAHHPRAAEEVLTAIEVIVPLNKPSHGQVSSSTPETFGAIALSAPPDPYTCAVTLAHEVQHVKLSALIDIGALTLPDDGRGYYAPWRPDPRPINGLLQGAYAYIGVCEFWRRERELARGSTLDRANQQFALWRMGTELAVETLRASGRLTSLGLDFVQGMTRTLSSWKEDTVPAAAQRFAVSEARGHMAQWEQRHGPAGT